MSRHVGMSRAVAVFDERTAALAMLRNGRGAHSLSLAATERARRSWPSGRGLRADLAAICDLSPEAEAPAPSEQGSPRAALAHPALRRSTSRSIAVPEVGVSARGIQRRPRNVPLASEPCGTLPSAHTSDEKLGPVPSHEIARRLRSAPERSTMRSVPDEPEVCSDAGVDRDKGGRWPIWPVRSVVRLVGSPGEVVLAGGRHAGRHRLGTLVASLGSFSRPNGRSSCIPQARCPDCSRPAPLRDVWLRGRRSHGALGLKVLLGPGRNARRTARPASHGSGQVGPWAREGCRQRGVSLPRSPYLREDLSAGWLRNHGGPGSWANGR